MIPIDLNDFLIRNKAFFWLLACLVEDSKVIPDLIHLWLQGGRLDDVLERLCVALLIVVQDGQGRPEDSFLRAHGATLL